MKWRYLSPLAWALFTALLAPLAVAQGPAHQGTGSTGLIAVDKVGNKIRFYDPKSLQETRVLDSPGPNVHELAISHDRRQAWIPLYGNGIYGSNRVKNHLIVIVDLVRQEIAGQIDTLPCQGPHGLAATRADRLWVVCDNNLLVEIDTAARRVIESFEAPTIGTHSLALLPDESKLYISNKEDDLLAFDMKARRFGARVSLRAPGREPGSGNGSGCEGLAITPDGRRVLVFDNDRSELHVIDTATDREVDRVALKDNPPLGARRTRLHKLMFSPDGKQLLAVNYAAGLAWIIDAGNLRRQTPISIAKGPQGIAFAPDGRTALVSNHDEGLITIIDLKRKRITGAVEAGEGIEALAYY